MRINAFVLGIDPGSEMGAALMSPAGKLVLSAQLNEKESNERSSIMVEAVSLAVKSGADLIIAREKWQAGGPHMNPRMAAGLGAAWGLWREQIHIHAPFLPPSRIHSVFPSTWRSRVLGAGAKSSGGWEAVAKTYVFGRFGLTEPGPDEVVAICVACWALVDAKVRHAVQDRPRWHALARDYAPKDLAAVCVELARAQARIQELERALANQAVAAAMELPDAD